MFIEEMQILVDCKRLVENMLEEKKAALASYDGDKNSSVAKYYIQKEIDRMEAALNGNGAK